MRFVWPWLGVALSGEPGRACHPGVILGRGAFRVRGWRVVESVGVPGGIEDSTPWLGFLVRSV